VKIETGDVLRSRYQLGGRDPGRVLDCLGTTLVIARRLQLCSHDPWRSIRRAWIAGESCASGFPSCWVRLADNADWQSGDVLLFHGRHHWAAIVYAGHVWSADEDVGSAYCRPVATWARRPTEVWRLDPSLHQEGPDRRERH